ncbi:dihydrolipoyl dehydrogenase family protein [Algihabitans albus]|uniref:dihydrolipoyl dehydrogenase family protein n=1 Tax=Algihabitans albus TaxID=2164067 RepID=UPI000E5CF457|nr:FAD-dependent oxidoreductase [Algihabitans albus]
MKSLEPDICVIGAGSAGLSIAAGASQMGAETVLIEKAEMGGDCLNYGCVPSKSLLVAGRAAQAWRHTAAFGIDTPEPSVDFARVHAHVRDVIDGIAPLDSVERFTGLGVDVIQAAAAFEDARTVVADGARIRAKRFVIATGSRPSLPPIEGLDRVAYLTNETVFSLTERPDHLIVIGGGPIGSELGQAFRHLGARVSLVEMGGILQNDDPELVEVVRRRLTRDGVELYEQAKVARVDAAGNGVAVTIEREGHEERIEGSHLLLAAGRQPTVEGLGLDMAGIAYDRRGIKTDARLRTSNKRVYAAGDVASGPQFTHMAGHHAGIVIKNALFRLPAKVETKAVPWVTYTEPELAHVGLTEAMARKAGQQINLLRWDFHENDRARAERQTEGLCKVVVTPKGKILGASIAGPQAGELIQPWVLAIANGLKISAMAQLIAPYPTLGEVSKRAAGSFYTPKLFSERTKKIVRLLLRLP